ncbi:MAG: NUDIX domain-containing protein, partial [Desulfobulbaceae bacterium]|nr:NUDIX domain-containing protein [Desulfobulbaceae bacterium]
VLSPDGHQVLLVHSTARSGAHHMDKYNGLGAKMVSGEDVGSCMTREIFEEAGITCEEMVLRGTVNWPGFGPKGENWLGFIFLITCFSGTPFKQNEEGTLGWHPLTRLEHLSMWEGDRFFLPLVFDGDPRIFHGHMPYRDGRPVSWSCSRM